MAKVVQLEAGDYITARVMHGRKAVKYVVSTLDAQMNKVADNTLTADQVKNILSKGGIIHNAKVQDYEGNKIVRIKDIPGLDIRDIGEDGAAVQRTVRATGSGSAKGKVDKKLASQYKVKNENLNGKSIWNPDISQLKKHYWEYSTKRQSINTALISMEELQAIGAFIEAAEQLGKVSYSQKVKHISLYNEGDKVYLDITRKVMERNTKRDCIDRVNFISIDMMESILNGVASVCAKPNRVLFDTTINKFAEDAEENELHGAQDTEFREWFEAAAKKKVKIDEKTGKTVIIAKWRSILTYREQIRQGNIPAKVVQKNDRLDKAKRINQARSCVTDDVMGEVYPRLVSILEGVPVDEVVGKIYDKYIDTIVPIAIKEKEDKAFGCKMVVEAVSGMQHPKICGGELIEVVGLFPDSSNASKQVSRLQALVGGEVIKEVTGYKDEAQKNIIKSIVSYAKEKAGLK